jgi:hypothetical protein
MGMLFTTEGTKRIVETLNTAFQDLSVIRTLPQYGRVLQLLQQPGNQLSSIAYVLRIFPYRQRNPHAPGDQNGVYNRRDAARWRYFLDNLDANTSSTIQSALLAAFNNSTINRTVCDHVSLPGVAAPSSVVVFDAPNPAAGGQRLMSITLMTVEIDPGNNGTPFPAPSSAQAQNPPWASRPQD